jgi:DNA mismatch repair protein MLH1
MLPELVLALARDVEWEKDEADRVAGVAAAVAAFYALRPLETGREGCQAAAGVEAEEGAAPMEVDRGSGGGADGQAEPDQQRSNDGGGGGKGGSQISAVAASAAPSDLGPHRRLADREWAARHVVFPAMKTLLRPQACRARDGSALLLTSMERLYRVFERCG